MLPSTFYIAKRQALIAASPTFIQIQPPLRNESSMWDTRAAIQRKPGTCVAIQRKPGTYVAIANSENAAAPLACSARPIIGLARNQVITSLGSGPSPTSLVLRLDLLGEGREEHVAVHGRADGAYEASGAWLEGQILQQACSQESLQAG